MTPEAAVGQNMGMAMHEVPVDLTSATVMAPSLDDGTAGWATPGRIPEAAVEAEHHWLLFVEDSRWHCSSCDFKGEKIEDYWTAHEARRHDDDIPF